MNWLEIAAILMVGASFGSFASLLIWRLPRDLPWVSEHSHCTACAHSLGVKDLFPVFSWVFSGGKCRYCAAPVSWRYPALEVFTAVLFLGIFYQFGITLEACCLSLLSVGFLVMFLVDLEHYILPDEMQWAVFLLGGALNYIRGFAWTDMLGGALLGLFVGAGLQNGYRYLKKREGMGTGDVKLLAVAGFLLGVSSFPVYLIVAGLLGVVTAIIWRLLGRGAVFPFGPALVLSLWWLLFFNNDNTQLVSLLSKYSMQ